MPKVYFQKRYRGREHADHEEERSSNYSYYQLLFILDFKYYLFPFPNQQLLVVFRVI